MDEHERRVLQIFREALDADDADRERLVAMRCADDSGLRERIEALLRGVDTAAAREATDATSAIAQPADPLIGATLGPFRVVGLIGRGGMGVVYRGEREGADFAQGVAIKLIRRGFDFEDVHARFLHERRILARLSHPNLARFIDGGVAGDGRPWFALEFVSGETITRWCDAHRLDASARMTLFLDVCAAVQYAHTQLVVHRDLKPGNVLVDDRGAVRLLDFGIAKLLTGENDPGATQTLAGRHALTPEYAAPEQFTGEAAGVAGDVYSLGVLAYVLLAGVTPQVIDRNDLQAARRSVLETPPQALVHAIGRVDDAAQASHESTLERRLAVRGTTLAAYRRQVRGDLSRILETALAKEPQRRYATVAAFADDLQRWLNGAPVRVSGNRFGYRLGKFVQRNRATMALAALAVATLLAGLGGVLWKSREALREAERANAVQAFLLSVFDSNTPGGAANEVPSTRDLLARGVERVQTEMTDQPLMQADLLTTFGRIDNQLNLFDEAEPLLRQARALQTTAGGVDAALQADTLAQLARSLQERHRFADALPLLDEALVLVAGRDAFREAAIRVQHGLVLSQSGRGDDGVAELRSALDVLRSHETQPGRKTASALDDLAFVLMQNKRLTEAADMYRQALAMERLVFNDVHADIGLTLSNLGTCLLMLGRIDEAEQAMRDAIAVDAKVYAKPHRVQAVHLANLAGVLLRQGATEEATQLFRESLRLRVALYGESSPEAAKAMTNLGASLVQLEHFAEANDLLVRASQILSRAPGDWRYWNANAETNRARAERGLMHWTEAEAAARRSISLRESIGGQPGEELFNSHAVLGGVLLASGKVTDARTLFESNLADSVRVLAPDHPNLAQRHLDVADAQFALAAFDDARTHYDEALRIATASLGARSPVIAQIRLGLADTELSLHSPALAARQLDAAHDALVDLPIDHSLRRRAQRIAAALPRQAVFERSE